MVTSPTNGFISDSAYSMRTRAKTLRLRVKRPLAFRLYMFGRSHHNVGLSRGFEVLTPRSRISQSPFIFEYVGLKSEFAGISSLTKSKREHLKLYFLLKILTLKLYDNADALVKNCAYVIVLGMNFNLMEK